MENTRICRACLVTDVKMYNMKTSSLFTTYLNLTGISDIGIYSLICYECVARLRKCEKFLSNCSKAHEVLIQTITTDLRRSREQNCLISPLNLSTVNFHEYIAEKSTCQLHILIPEVIKVETNNEQYNIECERKLAFNENIEKDSVAINDKICTEICDEDSFAHSDNSDTAHNVQHNAQEGIKYENYNETSDQIFTELFVEDLFQYNNSCDKKQNFDQSELEIKIQKGARNSKTRDSHNILNEDDEPLSKFHQNTKKKTVSNNITQSKRPKFDAKSFEEFATVTIMSLEDAKQEVVLRKESSNYKNCSLKCKFCYRGYETQKTYTNHMKKHSLAYGKHECEVCHLRFPKRYLCTKHMFNCHNRKFSCKICPYVCFGTSQALLHINFHKGVKYTCEMCQDSFSMPNTLLMHKRIKHPTEIVCALCGSTFTSDKGLSSHHRLIHKRDTNAKQGPQCVECDVHFATETAWKRHLVLSAKHTVSNGCESCGETFLSAESLKSHVKSHARIQRTRKIIFPTACTVCTKCLTSRDEYKEHMTSQHPDSDVTKRFLVDERLSCVCEFCGKTFKKHCFMVYHQRKHTGEKPYKCDVCEKRFSFPATLSAHKKTHSNVSCVKCDLCQKVFKLKNALNKHIKINHLNIRPHSCDVCGKSFHNLYEVKYHKQHVHGNVPWPKRDRSKRNRTNEEKAYLME